MIFNIQRFSLHDGEGLRTTVFFKGCPLSCRWCSNPESQRSAPELMFDRTKCIGCRDCLELSGAMEERDGQICLIPGRTGETEPYRDLCPARALQVVGENRSADEICGEILRDRFFFSRSGGGITLSGGEPLMQPELCAAVAERMNREGVPVSVETCLHVPLKNLEALIPYTDQFLCDIKHIDPAVFREHTGGDLNLILGNLRELVRRGAPVRARIPVIYGFNHDEKTIRGIVDFLDSLGGIKAVDFMPFHPLGKGKYTALGRSWDLPDTLMSREEIEPWLNYAASRDFLVTTGG